MCRETAALSVAMFEHILRCNLQLTGMFVLIWGFQWQYLFLCVGCATIIILLLCVCSPSLLFFMVKPEKWKHMLIVPVQKRGK